MNKPMREKTADTESLHLSLFAAGVSAGKVRLLDDFITPGKVLDVGCGNGLYGVHLESMGCNMIQIDLTDRRSHSAKHLPFRIMDAQNLDFADNEFDYVVAFDIMEHLDDNVKFLQNVRRICKHFLFLSVPNADDEQIAKFGFTHIHHKDRTHQREYTKAQLETTLIENGLKIIGIRPNYATGLPLFAQALAKNNWLAKGVAQLIGLQCQAFMKLGLFENRTVGDWYCVAGV
jgi:2-polyprenyl-3-methyl-5-hydroxy-6-metoxy-1,4-benzoquinol methylase